MKGVIIMISGEWIKVPCKIINDDRTKKSDILVFGYIADYLKDKSLPIPVSRIMEKCELSKSTVLRALDRLEQFGYLRADKRPGRPTVYTQLLISSKGKQQSERRSERRTAPSDGFEPEKYLQFVNQLTFPEEKEA